MAMDDTQIKAAIDALMKIRGQSHDAKEEADKARQAATKAGIAAVQAEIAADLMIKQLSNLLDKD